MWEDLSFKDRSKLIELGASQGILDLSTIKHLYNINANGGLLDSTFPEVIDNQHTFGDGGEEQNAYDKFYNSKIGGALQWVPVVGTALDIGNAINHPSWENAGWAAASLASDLFGGRIAAKAAKTAAKKALAKGAENAGHVLRRTPRGTILRVPAKAAAMESAVTTRLAYTGAFSSDNVAQSIVNSWNNQQSPNMLPEVVVTSKRGHKRADGGSLEYNEDNLLAPIIKYYEDTSPSLSIKDQNTFAKGGQMKRARQAVDYFVNKGLTREQAAGLVGNLMRESGMNIDATNPNSGAYGLSQWLGNRKTRLFRRYGYHPTFEQQLDYIWDELNTSHRKGLQMLRASKTVNDAARNAFGYYEFSAGPEAAIRAMNSSGKNTKWKNPNGTYALNSGIKNAQMIFGEVPVTMDNAGDTLALDTFESTPNIQPIISNDYAPVTTANLKELPTFGQKENNDSSIPSFGPQYLAQNLDRLGMVNPLNPFEKGYQLQSPKAIYADMQGLI